MDERETLRIYDEEDALAKKAAAKRNSLRGDPAPEPTAYDNQFAICTRCRHAYVKKYQGAFGGLCINCAKRDLAAEIKFLLRCLLVYWVTFFMPIASQIVQLVAFLIITWTPFYNTVEKHISHGAAATIYVLIYAELSMLVILPTLFPMGLAAYVIFEICVFPLPWLIRSITAATRLYLMPKFKWHTTEYFAQMKVFEKIKHQNVLIKTTGVERELMNLPKWGGTVPQGNLPDDESGIPDSFSLGQRIDTSPKSYGIPSWTMTAPPEVLPDETPPAADNEA